jgi:multiple sugar transport system ATP-binding protein
MRAEIILLRQKIDTTFIYVTHDQTEAMTLGDRIVIMKDGFIQQVGTPTEVFDMPVNIFVAEFIGAPKMNIFKSKLVCENGKYFVTPYGAKIEVTGKKAEMLKEKGVGSKDIILGVRPEHFVLSNANDPKAIPCKIVVNEMMGSELYIHCIEDDGDKIIVRIPTITLEDDQRKSLTYGSTIYVTFESKVMHFFDPETDRNLLV